ncbi:MAG: mmpl family/antibiotic transporter [Treponematales bacterium]
MERFFRRPKLIVCVIGLVTAFFAAQLPRAELDNNNFRFIPEKDEARIVSRYIDETFGSSLFVLVGLERKDGDIFEPEFLQLLKEYVRRVEEIEITGSVNSIVSSDYISGGEDAVKVEKLVADDFSGSPEEITELKRKLLSWDMYRRALISDDFTATQVLVPLEIASEDAGKPEAIDSFIQVRDIAREMFAGSAEIYVTGLPVISATINEAVRADLLLLVPLVLIVVLCILFFSFRRLTAVALPLLTVVISAVWSMGAMPLFGVKLSVVSTVLPVILVAVGSAYGIHVITHYLEEASEQRELDYEAHRLLVIAVIRKIGKAVFLAALTTFVGFSSFCFTSVLPIREFGFFSSFGVIVSFIAAVTLIPSLLIIRGPKPFKAIALSRGPKDGAELDNNIGDIFTTITRKKKTVLFFTAVIAAVAVYGVSKVVIDNIFIEYFRDDTDIAKSDRFIREKFGGSKVVSVVAQADTTEEVLHPGTLAAMDGLAAYLEKRVGEVGKVMGFTGLVKRINQVLNADENPDGLPASSAEESGGADFGFGGGEADDFGFGFGGQSGADTPAAAPRGNDVATQAPAKAYTAGEVISLMEKAASSGSSLSMDSAALVWQLRRLVNDGGAAYYEIPADPARYGKRTQEELQQLVSNYLVLLSGSIESYANDPLEPTAIKTTVQLRTIGEEDTGRAIDAINGYIARNFPPNIRAFAGGSAMIEKSLNRLVVQSQIVSVFVSLLAVFLIIALSNKSFIAGLIGVLPLSISILINFAVMGFLGIKLNIGTSMVASVAVGIGIDYTIHYLEAFKREYRASGGAGDFLRRTFTTSGKAIIINALSVGAGFAVLTLSKFVMLGDLGLLIAITMMVSAAVSLTVIPVLLLLFNPAFVRGKARQEKGTR